MTQAIIKCLSESSATAAASAASAGEVWGVTYTGTAGSDGDWLCLEGDDAEVNAVQAAIPSTAFDWADGRILDWTSLEGRFAKALLE
tara:strand:- start:905 stop:1165 length:261 start_codon:yes stop_codon:yes gene_type:complete